MVILFLAYWAAGYWAVNRTIYANKVVVYHIMFGSSLKYYRLKKSLSKADLAKMIGVSWITPFASPTNT